MRIRRYAARLLASSTSTAPSSPPPQPAASWFHAADDDCTFCELSRSAPQVAPDAIKHKGHIAGRVPEPELKSDERIGLAQPPPVPEAQGCKIDDEPPAIKAASGLEVTRGASCVSGAAARPEGTGGASLVGEAATEPAVTGGPFIANEGTSEQEVRGTTSLVDESAAEPEVTGGASLVNGLITEQEVLREASPANEAFTEPEVSERVSRVNEAATEPAVIVTVPEGVEGAAQPEVTRGASLVNESAAEMEVISGASLVSEVATEPGLTEGVSLVSEAVIEPGVTGAASLDNESAVDPEVTGGASLVNEAAELGITGGAYIANEAAAKPEATGGASACCGDGDAALDEPQPLDCNVEIINVQVGNAGEAFASTMQPCRGDAADVVGSVNSTTNGLVRAKSPTAEEVAPHDGCSDTPSVSCVSDIVARSVGKSGRTDIICYARRRGKRKLEMVEIKTEQFEMDDGDIYDQCEEKITLERTGPCESAMSTAGSWEGCSMAFKSTWALAEHFQGHTGEKPYKCTTPGCGKIYKFVSDFTHHWRRCKPQRNCLWILGHETTLLNSNSIWCSLVNDAKRHQCSFDAREDKYLAGAIEELCRKQVKVMQVPDTIQTPLSMGRVNAMHKNIAEDEVLAPLGVCSREGMLLEGPLSSHQDQSQVHEDDKEPQLTSRKRRKSADNDIGDKSDSCLQKKLNMSVQDMVKETEQMPLAQFSPSHGPSMKRARSLDQDQLASPSSCQPAVPSPSQSSQCASVAQLADELEQSLDMRPEVPEGGEPAQAAVAAGAGVPAQAVEAAVFPDATVPAAAVDPPPAPIIEHLEGLPQQAESLVRKPLNYRGPDGKRARKSLLTAGAEGKKYQTGINFYERARTATDERFWSIEQQDLYTSIYGVKKNFAQNKWIDWDGIRPYEEFQYVEKKCHDTGLHRVMAARHDWHIETIKQFFATFYINPSRTSLTWMTGINRKITVTKRFWEEILLDLSVHDGRNDYPKIEGSLTDKEEEQLRNANPTLINATNRMLRTTIFPKAGDKTAVHNENKLILYHILFGKPFDVVDMMFREIQKTRCDTRMLIPYAPYIMLLIKCASREEFVPESGATVWFKHPKYNIMPQKPRQPRNIRASESKQPFRVPPRPALVDPRLVPEVAEVAATLVAAAPAVPPLAPVRDPVAAEPPQLVDRDAQPPCQRQLGQCLSECLKYRSKEECLKEMLSEVPPEQALPIIGDYLASLPPRIQDQL